MYSGDVSVGSICKGEGVSVMGLEGALVAGSYLLAKMFVKQVHNSPACLLEY
jgi:hypothetical protein